MRKSEMTNESAAGSFDPAADISDTVSAALPDVSEYVPDDPSEEFYSEFVPDDPSERVSSEFTSDDPSEEIEIVPAPEEEIVFAPEHQEESIPAPPAAPKWLVSIYDAFARHPFFLAFLACLFLTPLCYGAQNNITQSAKMIWGLSAFALPAAALVVIYKTGFIRKRVFFTATVLTVVIGLQFSYMLSHSKRASLWIFAYAFIVFTLWRISVMPVPAEKDRHNAMYIMLTSFALKFCYVLYTSCYTRQNDVGSFDTERGHASYIEYLIQNLHLPDFHPASRWQYYHPPLHHTISAAWISLCENVFGASRNFARESLQMLMLFYSMAAVIAVYKLLRHFGFSGKSLILPLALFAFHPAYILSAGAINNDQLASLLTVLTILFTVRWAKDPTIRNIIPIALSIGFAMMTKLNAALIAPPVAVIFLWQLAKNLKKYKKLFLQYFIFGIICVPLGLWWSVRNLIKWNLDPTYIPLLGESNQFVGDDIFRRLTDFDTKQFYPVFENWIRKGSSFDEYNPNVAILKNSLFGEEIDKSFFPGSLEIIPTILFFVAMILALAGVIFTVVFFFRKDTRVQLHDKAFMAGFWLFSMYYFYLFCYLYPNTCTQNFRYIYHLLAVSAVQYAMFFECVGKGERTLVKKALSRTVTALIFAFIVFSAATYLIVGYYSV
ncbi:MAG: glycosyltransferase family 39 protein [Ruminococcus sp.]|nr:glycosyltransferase family 39 protein [Ruminococcus sp.]